MFDWFKKNKESGNVIDFPAPKAVPPIPEVKPPRDADDPAGKTHYKFGLTNNNRVAFQMGYTEITMNRVGCQQLIDQLTFYMGQLYDEDYNDNAS